MKLLTLLKAKALITVVAGLLMVGGATAAFAATPTGQTVVQSITHSKSMATADTTPGHADRQDTVTPKKGRDQGKLACSGLPDAQNLATSYHLSTDSTGNAVQDICTLHKGTFKATTTSGTAVKTSRVYGYGEIGQLLTYAQYLAGHDAANAGGKLTDNNVSDYLANALQSCGMTPLEKCLSTHIPNYKPGGNGPQSTATATGTPKGNKPTGTPTPKGNKPTSTPTPHK